MGAVLSNAVRLNHAALLRASGVDVVYMRSGNDPVEFKVVPANHRPQQHGSDLEAVTADEMDWLVSVSDLRLDDGETAPKRGDRMEISGFTYDVVERNEADCFRYTDHTLQVYRVFTIRTGVADG